MFEPVCKLLELNAKSGVDILDEEFAKFLDECDPLKEFRKEFYIPKNADIPYVDLTLVDGNGPCVYLCGNSLGLQPKSTRSFLEAELDKWATKGVYGHAHVDDKPWVTIDETVTGLTADVVGAKESEIAVMNSLTCNLHFLMVPFYQPSPERHKILIEEKCFPSDYYALQSQIKFHGYDPADSLVKMHTRENENVLHTEDILKTIEEQGDSIALIMFGGVNYYTGQFFDIKAITEAGHKKGCCVGFDLAHAAGNVELFLHDWKVDFACWCSYKYLNSGPGAIAGVFVHEKHGKNFGLPRFAGWWGHDKDSRFEMEHKFVPLPGAAGFQVSNPPVFETVSLLASLKLHTKATMAALRKKSLLLTSYMEYLLSKIPGLDNVVTKDNLSQDNLSKPFMTMLTPCNPEERGAQLSLFFSFNTTEIFVELQKRGVVVDERKPSVLRIAPAPIYNSFMDVYKFYKYFIQSYHVTFGK